MWKDFIKGFLRKTFALTTLIAGYKTIYLFKNDNQFKIDNSVLNRHIYVRSFDISMV